MAFLRGRAWCSACKIRVGPGEQTAAADSSLTSSNEEAFGALCAQNGGCDGVKGFMDRALVAAEAVNETAIAF